MNNLVIDGDFNLSIGSTPWQNLSAYPDQSRWIISSSVACYNPDYAGADTDILWQSISIVSGKNYRISFDVSGAWQYESGEHVDEYNCSLTIKLGGVTAGQAFADGSYSYDVVAGSDGKISIEAGRIYQDQSPVNLCVDNISVIEFSNLKSSLMGSVLTGKGLV